MDTGDARGMVVAGSKGTQDREETEMNDVSAWVDLVSGDRYLGVLVSPDGKECVIVILGREDKWIWVKPNRLMDENGDLDPKDGFAALSKMRKHARLLSE